MLWTYFNYPNPHVMVHGLSSCSEIQKMGKPEQRQLSVDPTTIGREVQNFLKKKYRFAAQAGLNDMWLTVDFEDAKFEFAVVRFLLRALGRHYRPFRGCEVGWHCRQE